MRGLKRLISGLLCSVLILGLVSNNGISNSHAEENVVTSDPSNLSESLESDNQIEQSSEPVISTENEDNVVSDGVSTELEGKIADPNNENNDISEENSNSSTEQQSDSSKKQLAKSNLAVAQTQSGDVFPIEDCKYIVESDGSITLTQYTGDKTDLVIPSKIIYNGQLVSVNVKINQATIGSTEKLFPENTHSITFVSIGGTKVGLKSDTNYSLASLFSTTGTVYSNLTSVDFSGLDMDQVTSMFATFYGQFVPNLRTINFGDNTLPNVTTMENAFNQLSNLESIDQHWKFGKLENMNQMFGMWTNQTSLTTIGDTSTWDTSTVKDMSQVFLNCSKLKKLDLSKWNVENVDNMNELFFNCQSLESIGDTANWNVSNVLKFTNMFYNCVSLHEIRMDNWHLNNQADLGDYDTDDSMFYLDNISEPFPALIVASDEKLLNISYSAAGYKPSCEIRINANTGQLAKNEYKYYDKTATGISYYFDKVAVPTTTYEELKSLSDYQLQNKIETWLESNVPTKVDYALRGWAPTDSSFSQMIEQITDFSSFMSSQAEFKAEWVSDKFDTSVDNTKLNPNGSLGLAYYPSTFTIGSTDLHSSGQQEILIPKTDSFNVGVKDRTRTKNGWHVNVQLIWTGTSIPDAYIQTTNSHGTVMQNISTGSGTYNSETDLQSLQGNDITGTKDYRITTTSNTIMKSTDGGSAVNNGVYDYDLGEAKLVIPDVSQVRAGTYSGQVEWNLVNGPE